MNKRKVVVTTGTRAEYGLMRSLLLAISKSKKLSLSLIVTGSHLSKKHGYTIKEIKKDGFKIASKIPMMPKNDTSYEITKQLGKAIIEFSNVFNKIKPDINVVLGDRDEMLASAVTAYHMNIPNVHIHGGDKSGGIDEYTRHAITKISNIHFPATSLSKNRIIKMGENPKNVFLVGSPAVDEISMNNISDEKQLRKKYGFDFIGSEILLIQHPVTTQIDQTKEQILRTLEAIAKLKIKTIAISPNSDAGNKIIFDYLSQYSKRYSFISLFQSLPHSDYLGMLKHCGILVGNSSSGIIEANYFNTPVVNIGIRQKNREKGDNVIDVPDGTTESIMRAIMKAQTMKKNRKFSNKKLYGNGNVSNKIVRVLETINLNERLVQKELRY